MKNIMKYLLVTQSLMPIQSGTFLPSLVLVSSLTRSWQFLKQMNSMMMETMA